MLYILVIFQTLIFICCCIFSIYLLILLIWSRGFTISPTVSSNKKSIKKIAEFLSNYIKEKDLKKVRILDIGSGYGKMLFGIEKELSKNKNLSQELVGYEISKIPCNISKKLNKSKNIQFFNDDIFNLKDFEFDFVITFILAKQQKLFLPIYRKFSKNTIIIANSLPIPFEENDNFRLTKTIKVDFGWNIYIYEQNF